MPELYRIRLYRVRPEEEMLHKFLWVSLRKFGS